MRRAASAQGGIRASSGQRDRAGRDRADRGRVTVVAALAVGLLVAPFAGDTASARQFASAGPAISARAGGGHGTIAQLEARIAALSKQYRGQLLTLSGAVADAKAADARALVLHRDLVAAQGQIARLAVATYLGGGPSQVLAVLYSGDSQQVLDRSAIIMYLAKQRDARERALRQLASATDAAERAAQAKIGRLRQLIDALERQRRVVERLLAKFHPQSPVIGDHITPRMRQVKDAIDARFGPFPAIGCYRQEATGEHPLGRACDFMLSTGGVMPTAPWVRRGYAIAQWAQANAARLGIMYIIYRQHIWDIRMASAGWVLMPDRGGITANHYDHVHISVF